MMNYSDNKSSCDSNIRGTMTSEHSYYATEMPTITVKFSEESRNIDTPKFRKPFLTLLLSSRLLLRLGLLLRTASHRYLHRADKLAPVLPHERGWHEKALGT
jgi:hypothetical protein